MSWPEDRHRAAKRLWKYVSVCGGILITCLRGAHGSADLGRMARTQAHPLALAGIHIPGHDVSKVHRQAQLSLFSAQLVVVPRVVVHPCGGACCVLRMVHDLLAVHKYVLAFLIPGSDETDNSLPQHLFLGRLLVTNE